MDKKRTTLDFEGRFHALVGPQSYASLVNASSTAFGIPANAVGLSYEDDETDLVALKSDMELAELYRMGGSEFRILVSKTTDIPRDSSPPGHEEEALAKVHMQLKSIQATLAGLESARVESNKKQKESSAYEAQIKQLLSHSSDLEVQLGKTQDDNKALQSKVAELERKLQNKDTEIEQKSSIAAQFSKEAANLKEVSSKMGQQLALKMKEIQELRKERENLSFENNKSKAILESLEKEVNKTREEHLHLSKVFSNVQAEREALERTTQDLKKLLEKESMEKETLQQSLYLGGVGNQVLHNELPPPVIHTPLKEQEEVDEKKTTEAEWRNELDILNNIGYLDRKLNLELLVQYQDMAKVVQHHKALQSSTMVSQRALPPGINEVDILMLENMGFTDLKHNIELLTKYKSLDGALAVLLN
eukprot:TRINITY_DN1049_c0_g1_i1.p1 TRINITY_DN1049_c0_g1~~TRINITY_DN1049_c0_g1_i1.p1  ORF type:complete len:419 (+),score=105.26 TRINITY_DN1049_c0_g1_i1:43-1299(+)